MLGNTKRLRELLVCDANSLSRSHYNCTMRQSGPQQLAVQIIVRHKLQSLYVIPAAAYSNTLLDGTDYSEPTAWAMVRYLQSHPVMKQRLDTTTVDRSYSACVWNSIVAKGPSSSADSGAIVTDEDI